jgi:hypothetical protein
MNDPKITFFMLVTDRDILIADYAVKSYAKIKNIPFKLQVYSNWISYALKQKYFPLWREFEFVEIIEKEDQTDENKPSNFALEGPFEMGFTIWDRELKKIKTPYYATVDADFEILDAKFISVMLEKLDANPNLVAMSTDYFKTEAEYYDSYSDEVIRLNERWHTWFCIYKREALQCNVSHKYYEEIVHGRVRRNAWDDAGYLQKALKEIHGFELAVLDTQYQSCFVHYGQFSKNIDITENNVKSYRQLQILRKRGLFGSRDIFTRKLAGMINKIVFDKANKNRGKFVDGWGSTKSII